jgi:hypothetical protein
MPSVAETVDAASITRTHGLHGNVLLDYVGGPNAIYVGWAAPGSDPAGAVWRIVKLTWDGNNNPTAIQWAGGDALYTHIWNNRVALSYS